MANAPETLDAITLAALGESVDTSPYSSDAFAYHAVIANLANDLAPISPSASVKQKLIEAIAPKPSFHFADEGIFRQTAIPGIRIRIVRLDRKNNLVSAFLQLDAGATLHSHIHDGVEECLVLQGSINVGNVRMNAGDYQRCEPNSAHHDQTSPEGALLYITGPLSTFEHS